MRKLRILAIVTLVVIAFNLAFGFNEAAYMAWTRGGPDLPDQMPRDLGAAACIAAAGVLFWVGQRRKR